MSLPFFSSPDNTGAQTPVAMAHRGFSREGLENSMAAFRAAVELGYRYLETDVHTTADGVVLVFHDDTLDRVTDGSGQIAALTAAEVVGARISGREPIPTFDDLVTGLPGARLNVDVKDWNSVRSLAAAIERHQAHSRVLVTSFSDRRRRAVLKLLSRPVASSAGVVPVALFTVLGRVLPGPVFRWTMRHVLHGVQALQVPVRRGMIEVVTPGFIRRAHALGLVVHVWTVNEPAEMRRLLRLGVDGIVTDRADLLRDVLQERGEWPGQPED
ncbi:glycerophosphodiester phosphodiesterase [Pseudarthrobacter sp. R1]|uniref:glycerophosphodiester phosphodiesterase n=1 Tax=Pseudarthrobacter sp. R1 TaxID=2944934 RepID=UPI00210A333A|nr:glycerophosphodiester phosphodiesterase [Pseudarthrobacter sp. R1]MCQ6272354.1 glycerophosphodiester phosphodiesterase [Pseudarthrobacter sp. R1]